MEYYLFDLSFLPLKAAVEFKLLALLSPCIASVPELCKLGIRISFFGLNYREAWLIKASSFARVFSSELLLPVRFLLYSGSFQSILNSVSSASIAKVDVRTDKTGTSP